ncbi:MAG: hypothetical protein NVS1B10_03420 [Candidatus Saccharimonadales bacterium]
MIKKIEKFKLRLIRYRRIRLKHRVRKFKLMSRHPFAVPIITFLILIGISAGGYMLARRTHNLPVVHGAKIVIISYDHQKQIVPSKEATVGDLLQKLHLKLNLGDIVEPAQTAIISQDQFRINIYRATPVQIVDGNQKTYTFSASKTPRSIAQQAGTNLFPEDITTTNPVKDFVSSGAIGEQVIIKRATPINVDLYGTKVVIRTHAATVADLMKERHIVLAPKDQISPAPNTPLSAAQQVSFIRTGTKVETVTEDIPTPIQTVDDPSLAYGTSAVRQQGSPGQRLVTYQISITNNVETSRSIIQSVVNKEPVTQITVVGSSQSGVKGDMSLAGISPSDYEYVDYIVSHESGWCPTKAQGQYGGCPAFGGNVPSYGGYGLCQSTPGSKMASSGSDWATNPITQLRWCSGYAQSRYGSWYNAYAHWMNNHNW